jgi:hypothetical protein
VEGRRREADRLRFCTGLKRKTGGIMFSENWFEGILILPIPFAGKRPKFATPEPISITPSNPCKSDRKKLSDATAAGLFVC